MNAVEYVIAAVCLVAFIYLWGHSEKKVEYLEKRMRRIENIMIGT